MCGRFPCIISDILGIARIEQDILGCVGIDQDGWEVYSNINNIRTKGGCVFSTDPVGMYTMT